MLSAIVDATTPQIANGQSSDAMAIFDGTVVSFRPTSFAANPIASGNATTPTRYQTR